MHSANGGGSALQTHAPAHAAPVVGPSGGSRTAETLEKSQEGRFRERGSAPTTAETDNLRNNFASLNVGQQTKIDGAVPAQQAAATAAAMQSNASLAFSAPSTDNQQMPYSMPAQAGASGYGQPYPQYAPQYSQQFAQMQSNYPPAQDGEDFNAAGRMQGMGIGESGYAISGGESGVAQRGNSGSYGGKGAHGKQVQQPQQQPGMGMQQWQQAPLLNQYPGMMSGAAAAMYSQYAMAGIPTAQQVCSITDFLRQFKVQLTCALSSDDVHAIIHGTSLRCWWNPWANVQQYYRIPCSAECCHRFKGSVQCTKSEQGTGHCSLFVIVAS